MLKFLHRFKSNSFDVAESIEICDMAKVGGVQCTTCNFLTFGQENVGFGLSFFCPHDDSDAKYCCYGPLRKPFCCNASGYILTGLVEKKYL